MKKILEAFLATLLVIALCMNFLFAWSKAELVKSGPLAETKIVMIERGMGVSDIAQKLVDEGVISSELNFKLYVLLDFKKPSLKAGEYEFPAKIPAKDIIFMLRSGKVYERKITIPEGLTVHQILTMLRARTDMTGEIVDVPIEGSLLPETYHYVGQQNRNDILKQMKNAMDKTLAELWPLRAAGLPIENENELLTLASIVEKETGVADERAKIAGVFINRLRRGMPLQTDPTVIYAMTLGKIEDEGQGPIGRRLLTKDLSIESPYNTYLNVGLPPTPIANPGRAAIEAVLHPEIHDYIYFVADGGGGHAFATTLERHNANVARWRKIRKNQ